MFFSPGMTSIKGILLTGLKKCIPMNFSGRLRAEAISVIDKEDVLEASIALSER
jgi:hypothetical protein